ncbi:hypothetical protein CY34DRAFT_809638 [Suillus luteus UH-Slu-Lm8-n1]|uniref:Uncharacterized protein n=1 Tax=Suillus luteus UH-Slu-Lm8-n1 TaxID=930992 RepID=A0A0D0AJ45_9AGAM|nr:hypothetical protein CY34DRAFT_809638 [Suillus luteus UH-Slu-Lm8-n1]
MRAPPSFFGYQIFAALVPPSSACNLEDMMTLPLHYRLVSSGDLLLLRSRLLFAFASISARTIFLTTSRCESLEQLMAALNDISVAESPAPRTLLDCYNVSNYLCIGHANDLFYTRRLRRPREAQRFGPVGLHISEHNPGGYDI